jgi:hypothetical protein
LIARLFSILFYVLAGAFFYTAAVVEFLSPPPNMEKASILPMVLLPGFFFLAIGLWCSPTRRWNREAGIVLLSTAAVSSFAALSIVCVVKDPEAFKSVSPENMQLLREIDYTSGTLSIVLLVVLGIILIYAGRTTSEPRE